MNETKLPLGISEIRTRDEAEWCAGLMSSSEPWTILGRTREQALAIMDLPDREVYLARAGEEPAGFLIIVMSGALVGYIQSIGVAPALRGGGIGKALMDFAEKRIFSRFPNVFIHVSSFNPRAKALYERLGYEFVADFKDYIIPGHSELLLRKSLGPIRDFRPS